MDPNLSLGKIFFGEDVVVILSDKVEGSGDWKGIAFYQMETEEVCDRFMALCFVNGLEAYDGEINLGVEENMISNEYAVKLCLEHEVQKGNKVVKKELIVALRGEIYFVKFIINPEEDDVEPRVIFGRSFLRLAKAITNFGVGTVTIYPDIDPFLEETKEKGKSNDDWDHFLDFNIDDVPLLGEKGLSPFVCKIGKSSRNKKRAMENLNFFYQDIGTSSSAGGHLTQEKAAKEAIVIRMSRKFALLEEERLIIETMAYHDKYKKILDEVWKDKVELDGKIVKEEEEAIKRIKGEALKEKDDPRSFIFPIRLEGHVNENALADTGSDINTMPFRIYVQLGRDDIKKVDRGITMINHTQAKAMGILTNVLCQTMGTHHDEAGSSRSKCPRQHETMEEVLLPQIHHEFLLWEGCNRDAKSRAFNINELTYAELCHKFYSTYEFDEVCADDELQTKKIIKFRLGGCAHNLTLLKFARRLGLYQAVELKEEGFNVYFERGLHSDEHFNAQDYWLSISREENLSLSRSHTSTIKNPILRVIHKMITYGLCQRTTEYDKIQKNDLWLLSMFDARHQNGYANVAWIARKCRVLTEDVVRSLSAPVYYRDLDTITLRDLIKSDEIHQEAIEWMEYRQSYQWDMYQGVFEHMAGVYNVPMQGAYNPPRRHGNLQGNESESAGNTTGPKVKKRTKCAKLRSPSNFKTIGLVQQWQPLSKIFARCLTMRVTGHDQPPLQIMQMLYCFVNNIHVDYAELLWGGLHYELEHLSIQILYPRFTKPIIGYYMTEFPKISHRSRDKYHNLEDDVMVKNIFNSRKHKDDVGMKIPSWKITDEMKLTDHYRMSPNPETNEGESSALQKSTIIRLHIPQRRSTRLTPPTPIPTTVEADDIILQDTIQLSLAEQKSRDEREAKQNVKNTRLEPRSDKESLEVEITTVEQPINIIEDEEKSAEDYYELRRREKGKHVEEFRSTPSPTTIRSPRTHSTLISLATEKLQELTVTDPPPSSLTPSSSSPKLKLYAANRLLSLFKPKHGHFT
ncbi:hypothetical protein Tco_0361408 [Tanacetum coccineum]